MNRKDWLAIILILLSLVPFVSNKCLVSVSQIFIKETSKDILEIYSSNISEFKRRRRLSAILVVILFCVASAVAYFYSGLNLSHVSWLTIISTILITITVFDQLGWELTWSGVDLIDLLNKWWFRVMYSIGVIFLFLALLQ